MDKPRMKPRIIVIFVFLIVLIALEIFLLTRCVRRDRAAEPAMAQATPQISETLAPASTPEPTAEPTPAPTDTPAPTPEPTAEPTPSPTPEPTATPSPTPEPTPTPSYGTVVAQGSFSSDTGTAMNMNIEWVAYDDGAGSAVVAVTGTVTSYSLQLATLYNAATVEFAGVTAVSNTRPVNIEENNYTVSPLFYTTVTVPLGTTGDMNVSWRYGGSYGGTAIDIVTATGTVTAG